MSQTQLKSTPIAAGNDHGEMPPRPLPSHVAIKPRLRIFPVLITLGVVILAAALSWTTWQLYMETPWTRDGTVRAYVVTIAPEVGGRIVELHVADNQFVHNGELLMVIDPTDYVIGLHQAEAAIEEAKATEQNARAESDRRRKLTNLAVSDEDKQIYASRALSSAAAYQRVIASRDQARANLQRTRIVAPVNGYVTNLLVQLGDYVTVGEKSISVVNSDSFWVDGYFEETNLRRIQEGDSATIKLMGYSPIVRGHVDSIARGINVANAQPSSSGLASVNPIFTWVRLAQRVPVRVHIDEVPKGVRLVVGMTATVQIDERPR
jgi:multidrug resistance efflux pump